MRSLALLLLVTAPPLFADQWSKIYTPAGTPEIRLDSPDGNITVIAGDHKDITARVTTAGWKISGTQVRILESLAGNVLALKIVTPEVNLSFARHSVKLELEIPRESNCEIQAGIAKITVTGLKGAAVLASKAGGIEAHDLDGKLEAITGEGKIHVSGRFDLLTLRSGYGAIDLDAAPGSRMFSEWRISTEEGNVVLHLPAAFAADLDAQSDAGHVSIQLPFTPGTAPDQGKAKGQLNAGGEALVLRTNGGDIRLLKK